jgi:hypothetical protein
VQAAAGAASAALLTASARPGWASGGATAGKYTTIPIAKRRYFGRVKQGVYELLLVGKEVMTPRGWMCCLCATCRPRPCTTGPLGPVL